MDSRSSGIHSHRQNPSLATPFGSSFSLNSRLQEKSTLSMNKRQRNDHSSYRSVDSELSFSEHVDSISESALKEIDKIKHDYEERLAKEKGARLELEAKLKAAQKVIDAMTEERNSYKFFEETENTLQNLHKSQQNLYIEKSASAGESNLSRRVDDLSKKLKESEFRAKNLQAELKAAKEEAEKSLALQEKVNDLNKQLQRFKGYEKAHEGAMTKISFLERDLDEWQEACKIAFGVSRNDIKKEKNFTARGMAQDIKGIIIELKHEKEKSSEYSITLKELEAKIVTANEEIEKLRANESDNSSKIRQLETDIAKAEDKINHLEGEKKGYLKNIRSLESFNEKNADVELLKKRLEEVEKEKNEAVDSCNLLEDKMCEFTSLETFNPDRMKVIHMKDNPISRLQNDAKMNSASQSALPSGSTNISLADNSAEIYKKRFKEQFTKTVNSFKELVFELTGYKFKLVSNNAKTQLYKVQSKFATSDKEELLFTVECNDEGKVIDASVIDNDFLNILDHEIASLLRSKNFPESLSRITLKCIPKI